MTFARMMTLAAALCLSTSGTWAAALPPIPQEARAELADFARKVLAGQITAMTDPGVVKLNASLRQPMPEELFITLFRDRAPGVRFGAQKPGLAEATFAAMSKARTLPSFEFYGFSDSQNVTLLFERVSDRRTIPPASWVADIAFLDLGVEGISIRQDPTPFRKPDGTMDLAPARGGTMPPSEVYVQGFDSRDDFVNKLCFQVGAFYKLPHLVPQGSVMWDKNLTHVDRVTFETFVSREGAVQPVTLFRMNDLSVTPWKDTLAAARQLGDKLARYQLPDGRFFARFESRMGRFNHLSINVVDHATACLALADLAAVSDGADRARYLEAAERGLMHLRLYLVTRKDTKAGKPFTFVVQDQEAKLGAAALAALAVERVTSLTGTNRNDEDLRQLGRFLVTQQDDDGSFRHFYRYDPTGEYHYRLVAGFPGQAVWALAVLEKRLGEKAFGDAARKGAKYLVTKREEEMHWAEAPTDPWLGAALRELSTPFAEASYVAYAKRMADHTVKRQRTNGDPDMLGLFEGDREGSTAGTALGITLLGQALDFTAPAPDAQKQYAASMRAAIRFLHLNEIRANNSFFLVSPERAYGFIRNGTFDTDVDLATTAACVEALLGMDRVEKMK